jgi:hypothetical protein
MLHPSSFGVARGNVPLSKGLLSDNPRNVPSLHERSPISTYRHRSPRDDHFRGDRCRFARSARPARITQVWLSFPGMNQPDDDSGIVKCSRALTCAPGTPRYIRGYWGGRLRGRDLGHGLQIGRLGTLPPRLHHTWLDPKLTTGAFPTLPPCPGRPVGTLSFYSSWFPLSSPNPSLPVCSHYSNLCASQCPGGSKTCRGKSWEL